MSKRKNRKANAPNLPKEVLDRARQEAGLIPTPISSEAQEVEETEEETVETLIMAEAPEPKRKRDALPQAQATPKRKNRRKQITYEEMTPEEVAEALANPTIVVTEEALREQYSYVLTDLRSMAILAAILFVALIVIAGVIVA